MKTFIISIIMLMLFGIPNANAQKHSKEIIREGSTFKQKFERTTSKKDTLVTAYSFEDSKGKKYPIIINRKTGRCYIWRTSRDGKQYPSYMEETVCRTICKELNVAYKEKGK